MPDDPKQGDARPVRDTLLPYGKHSIDDEDIAAVVEVLKSGWLTTGPKVKEFEERFAEFVGAKHAVAISNGTTALHAATVALGISKGDEVIVTPLTFAASANCVLYQGGTPVFADVIPDSLLIDPEQVKRKLTSRTKAIIAVDYAGHPCDYDALREIADHAGIQIIDDACHALGGSYKGRPVGTLGDLNTFSFHPVKPLTTGEGGMITTDNEAYAKTMRTFRSHGIATDFRERERTGSHYYEMISLGHNFRLTDIQCALGLSQLRKLCEFTKRRHDLAAFYDRSFSALPFVTPLSVSNQVYHAYHLYVVRFDTKSLGRTRDEIFAELRAKNVGVNVHYLPVHLHPYYRNTLGTRAGLCPVAESAYQEIITLPIFPGMTTEDAKDVVEAINRLAR